MPWKADHKLQSREKVISAAATLFTRKGFNAVTIDEVMKKAGLTRGAFYAHFKSKSDIYNQAVIYGARKARKHIKKAAVKSPLEFAEDYLKIGSPEGKLKYCTLAFLVTDIAQQENDIKSTYTEVLKGYQGIIRSLNLSSDAAIQVSTLLIGGLAISRSVTDKQLRDDILRNSLAGVKTIIDNETT